MVVGLALAPAIASRQTSRPDLRVMRGFLTWCVVAACLPDIDFGWGRHNMETHSIGFALLIGGVILAWHRSPRLALACTLSAGTHVLFDWLGSDDFPPLGVMALWPWKTEFYFAEAYIFATISRRYWLPGFIEHNLLAVLREVVQLAPVAVAVLWFRTRQRAKLAAASTRNVQ
jgi:membrane-bound metal-dependent hydrolase YbcI (DUF457 family)